MRSSKFEASNHVEVRDARLTYIFLGNPDEKSDIDRYYNPYRIEVVSQSVIVDSVNIDPGSRKSLFFRLKHFFGIR